MEPSGPKAEEIRPELERVLASEGFARNERLSRFLRFVVERHLEGRDSELKESVLGVEVFGRKPGYDPKLDGTVRTEAIRLRTRLEKYYGGEGSRNPVVIELPKGAYRPVFRQRTALVEDREPAPAEETTDAPVVPAAKHPRAGLTWWVAIAAVFVLVAAGIMWHRTRATRPPQTIAVLPLENLSKDTDTDYFADGLTDEIIRNLSIIEGLTVLSRTSSFALKGKGLSAADAGRQLGAAYLVEGSVLRAGDQLRINMALVGARDGSRIWSDRYDRELTDVFAIQDEISRGIVNTLRLRLSGRRRYEANLEAYDLYLRGRQIMAAFPAPRGRPVAIPALEYFQRAIDRDPTYAIAYAGMADAYIAVERNMGAANKLDAWPRAQAAAAKALELDPELSEAHSAMAAIHARQYAWQDAERGFRRAIALNPNNALAHLELGIRVLVVQGRFDEGLAEVRSALALDPLSPYVNTAAGEALLLAGRYDEAVEQLRKAIALDPSRVRPHSVIARVFFLQGKIAEALAARDQSLKLGATRRSMPWTVCAEERVGRREQALVLLQELRDAGRGDDEWAYRGRGPGALARAYACVGEDDHALASLEQAFAEDDPIVPELLLAPELSSLRPDPRFAALRKRMNLQ